MSRLPLINEKQQQKKKYSLTQLQFIGIEEEKKEKGKSSSTLGHDLKPSPQSLFLCVNLARNPLKERFKKKFKKTKIH